MASEALDPAFLKTLSKYLTAKKPRDAVIALFQDNDITTFSDLLDLISNKEQLKTDLGMKPLIATKIWTMIEKEQIKSNPSLDKIIEKGCSSDSTYNTQDVAVHVLNRQPATVLSTSAQGFPFVQTVVTGFEQDPTAKEAYCILLTGETGAGKSTMINALINNYYGISFNDPRRVVLIPEGSEADSGARETKASEATAGAQSQTSAITAYLVPWVPGCSMDKRLVVIDTPGFGDTRGLMQDAQIMDQFKALFNSGAVETLNVVGLVVKCCDNRANALRKYVFAVIGSMFHENARPNVAVLASFYDSTVGCLPVLRSEGIITEADKGDGSLPSNVYTFNNGALFTTSGQFAPIYWETMNKSFRSFMDSTKGITPHLLRDDNELMGKSDALQGETMTLRKRLRLAIDNLNAQKQLRNSGAATLELKTQTLRKVMLPQGRYVTNCITCSRTCHYPCYISPSSTKQGCAAMSGEFCRRCREDREKACHFSDHVNMAYRFEVDTVTETLTLAELQTREAATRAELIDLVRSIQAKMNELEGIQLRGRGSALDLSEMFKLMYEEVKNETTPGKDAKLRQIAKMIEVVKVQAALLRTDPAAAVAAILADDTLQDVGDGDDVRCTIM